MDFKVFIDIAGNVCSARIDSLTLDASCSYYFYLLKDGRVLDRTGWVKDRHYTWEIKESGVYAVQGHVRKADNNIFKISKPSVYHAPELIEQFEELCCSECCVLEDELPVYTPVYPYQNFIFASGVNVKNLSDQQLYAIDSQQYFVTKVKQSSGVDSLLLSTRNARQENDETLLFSGTTRDDSKLLLGDEDFFNSSVQLDSDEQIGNYHYVRMNKKQTTITTDYFGLGKIFYYYKDNVFIAANSYHLLLRALCEFKITLALNIDKTLMNFVFMKLQPFHQNFSHQMEIKNAFVLPIDEKIICKDGKVFFEKKAISNVFRKIDSDQIVNYKELVEEAAKEITDNIQIALDCKKFENVILDLTGGLDSRVVYAGLTNLERNTDKVRINSEKNIPNDLAVAITLNSYYKYKYNDLAMVKKFDSSGAIEKALQSYTLGNYYSFNLPNGKNCYAKSIRLNGFGGEIVARPYYSRNYLNTELDITDVTNFVAAYIDKYLYMASCPTSNNLVEKLKKELCRELEEMPGRSPLEKFEFHYLYFRNGLHCNDCWRSDVSCVEWGPLQSKKLFALKHAIFQKEKNIKLQLDVLNTLNPLLARVPYESADYNAEMLRLEKELIGTPAWCNGVSVDGSADTTDWLNATKVSEQKTTTEYSSSDSGAQPNHSKTVISILRQVLEFVPKEFKDTLGLDLFRVLTAAADDPARKNEYVYLSNKLFSLYYQIAIINRSCNPPVN